jgi:hypothetical protein
MTGGPEGVDDLFMDISEAYMGKQKYREAGNLLELLANSPSHASVSLP